MLLQPLLHSAMVVFILLLLVSGFVRVLSLGKVIPIIAEPSAPHHGTMEGVALVAGMQRNFEFTGWQWASIFYWLFGFVWILETAGALGQFAISHTVVGHTCLGLDARKDSHPMLRGYLTGIVFHLGTLAFAAFVIGCLKFVAAMLWLATNNTGVDRAERRSAVAAVCCCCCTYCVACAEHLMIMVNDLVYTDVALQGTDYLEAAENVVCVAGSNPLAYATVKGIAATIRVVGVTTIGGGGTFLSYKALTSSAAHRTLSNVFEGASQGLATSSILGTTVCSAIICFYVGLAFMVVFYQTTEALLYCKLGGAVGTPCSAVREPSIMGSQSSERAR